MVFLTTKLSELIAGDCITDLQGRSKSDVLLELSELLQRSEKISDGAAFHRALMAREAQASTGVGLGIAIPHVKIPQVVDYVVGVGRSKAGVEFDAIDGKPVHLIFMIGASDRQTREFVKILAQVTHLLKSAQVRDALMHAEIPDQFLNVIRENER